MAETKNNETTRKLSDFKKAIDKMISTSDQAYEKNPLTSSAINSDYTIDSIRELIINGDPSELTEVSRYFYRFNGIYRSLINYYASLLLYQTIVSPIFNSGKTASANKLQQRYDEAQNFLRKLGIAETFTHITQLLLKNGVYYGLFYDFGGGKYTIQDLPVQYCRTRFKNEDGINLVEFDLKFFDRIFDEQLRTQALDTFPKDIKKAYNAYRSNSELQWFQLPQEVGVGFYYQEPTPLLVSSLPSILSYDEAQDREAARDEQDLMNLLIQKLPINSKTEEPVFSMEEMTEIHRGTSEMLKNQPGIDVITTFAEASLENAKSNSQVTRDNLEKYKRAAYDATGSSSAIFNADGNIALKTSITKDIGLMYSICLGYANWLTFQVNDKFSDSKFEFDVEILPLSIHNLKEMNDMYIKNAQFGMSKIYASVTSGIKQSSLPGLLYLENDVLKLNEKMIPLASSSTQSGDDPKKSAQNPKGTTKSGDKTNEGGRTASPDDQKDDKTLENENSK